MVDGYVDGLHGSVAVDPHVYVVCVDMVIVVRVVYGCWFSELSMVVDFWVVYGCWFSELSVVVDFWVVRGCWLLSCTWLLTFKLYVVVDFSVVCCRVRVRVPLSLTFWLFWSAFEFPLCFLRSWLRLSYFSIFFCALYFVYVFMIRSTLNGMVLVWDYMFRV